MIFFAYDQTFEGLLTVIFESYRQKIVPGGLLALDERPPLLAQGVITVVTDLEKSGRVWAGLEKRLSPLALKQIVYAWLTEERAGAEVVVRYVRAVLGGVSETNFGHPDVLGLRQEAFKVSREKEHMLQFVRFQKTRDGLYFAALAPVHNAIPLVLDHFADRFADQKWIIYDLNRDFGFYYDLEAIHEIDSCRPVEAATGRLAPEELAEGEEVLQEAWRAYFQAVNIPQRANPHLQRQYMPKRFWPFLTEKQPPVSSQGE